jgi:hypothetical protein
MCIPENLKKRLVTNPFFCRYPEIGRWQDKSYVTAKEYETVLIQPVNQGMIQLAKPTIMVSYLLMM